VIGAAASLQSTYPVVVGIYARYSNDQLQRDASIDDQIRTCSELAGAKGWIVDPLLIFTDAGMSGAQMATREGLKALLDRIESDKSRSYKGFIFDDTSRLGRNLAEVLSFCKLCEYHQVFLFFANQELDSRDPNFYQLINQYATGDEQFLKKLKHAVVRGQKGRIAEGMIHGGRYYGYKGDAIPDPSKRSTASKLAIKGVKLVIDEVEAEVVRAIYAMAESGQTLKQIAKACITVNYPRPQRLREATSTWTPDNVGSILHNRIYCGYLIYGRGATIRHPITGKEERRQSPESQWLVRYTPELAIVSVEQWERVQVVIDSRKNLGLMKLGGMSRRCATAPTPLFSGLLICGGCSAPFVVTGKDKHGDRLLQCKSYRYDRKSCACSYSITESSLERHLIDHLVGQMFSQNALDSAIDKFHSDLNARLMADADNHKRAKATSAKLIREQQHLDKERTNIIASLRQFGPSESLRVEFQRIEGRLNQIASLLQQPARRELVQVSLAEARQYVHAQSQHMTELLLADRATARQAILRFMGPLTIHLDTENHPPAFRIKGGLRVCE
jgi:site-specific DNA recombinase